MTLTNSSRMFHSHIMQGARQHAPLRRRHRQSATLLSLSVGPTCLGGIFSLDGFIRLYSTCRDFNVALYGTGAEIVSVTPRRTIIKLHGEELIHVGVASKTYINETSARWIT